MLQVVCGGREKADAPPQNLNVRMSWSRTVASRGVREKTCCPSEFRYSHITCGQLGFFFWIEGGWDAKGPWQIVYIVHFYEKRLELQFKLERQKRCCNWTKWQIKGKTTQQLILTWWNLLDGECYTLRKWDTITKLNQLLMWEPKVLGITAVCQTQRLEQELLWAS